MLPDVLTMRVDAMSGHYKLPGPVKDRYVAASFPIAPPSTMRGFLESNVGSESGTFEGEFAYGWLRRPLGHSRMLRRIQAETSAAKFISVRDGKERIGMMARPIFVDTLFDLSYCVMVRGPWVARCREALAGNVERYGVLSLGESTDIVSWVGELPEPPPSVQWVVPGQQMVLPVKSGRGFSNLTDTVFGSFDLKFGEPHWHAPVRRK